MFRQFYQGSDLMIWPLIGLGIFFLAFVAILLHVLFALRGQGRLDDLAALPLDDGTPAPLTREESGNE